MKRTIKCILMASFFLCSLLLVSHAGEVALPKTGQTTCYDASGSVIACENTGQDGDVQAGVAWPGPRFEDNGDGTITDHLTRLVWLKNAACIGSMPWANALASCSGLANGICGLTDGSVAGDWRLPNVVELESLFNSGANYPNNWLNDQGFDNMQLHYWSTTTFAQLTDSAWIVYMSYGHTEAIGKSYSSSVWPVRAGQ